MTTIDLEDRLKHDREYGAGSRTWYFPDGDLPWPERHGPFEGHESLLVLNVANSTAHLEIDIYWTDSDPVLGIIAEVEPERIAVFHPPYGKLRDGLTVEIPVRAQYSLRVRSSVPVVCQYGRVECRPSFAMYTTMGLAGGNGG